MNREIKTKKVGKQKKLTNPCPVIKDDGNKRILRCSEGNMVWYRLWINPEDMMRIEPLLKGGDRIWMEELEMYYTFFYEIRNGRRVLGKNRIKEILDILL